MGLMLSVYFSAILSTADSCLMAASGNLLTDILARVTRVPQGTKGMLRLSQWLTLALGAVAILIAAMMENVLDLMLSSYAFMVSGLLVPLVAAVFGGRRNARAAIGAMLGGGFTTIALGKAPFVLPYGLDANVFGIAMAAIIFLSIDRLMPVGGTPLVNGGISTS